MYVIRAHKASAITIIIIIILEKKMWPISHNSLYPRNGQLSVESTFR